MIQADHKEEIHKYIAGIIRKQNQKLIAIGGMPDHLHALIGMKPGIALSDLVRDVKSDSSVFTNGKKWVRGKFNWQGFLIHAERTNIFSVKQGRKSTTNFTLDSRSRS